jgi:hypothetical protein
MLFTHPPHDSLKATTGGFVKIPRGTIHAFLNAGITTARMLLFFSGINKYFEEVLEPVQDRSAAIPKVTAVLIARMVGAGPSRGMEFV